MTQTVADVKNAEALGRNYKLADGKGLFLLVTSGGTKSWRFKYRFGRKEKLLTLGQYPDVGLAAARVLHEDAQAPAQFAGRSNGKPPQQSSYRPAIPLDLALAVGARAPASARPPNFQAILS